MDRNSFENLLIDLYDIYNPVKKTEIPKILTNYNGMEFDAIYHLLLKYNYPRSAHYNPKVGGEKQIKLLIESYSKGERNAKDIIVSSPVSIDDQLKNIKSNVSEQVSEQVNEQLKGIEEKFNKFNKDVESEQIETTIELLFDNSEYQIKIPESFKNSGPGTRIIVLDKDGRIHGLEVKDVLDDLASYKGKHIRTVQIDKI